MLTGRLCGGIARYVAAVEFDAAGVRFFEAGDHAQRRRLAATRRPEQRIELAGRDVQIDTRHGGDPGERLDQLLQPDRAALHWEPDQAATTAVTAKALGEPGEVRGEPVDIVRVVLNRQQPLLHLPPWREKHTAIVLHEPVQVAESGVDLEEIAKLADPVAAERHAALGAYGHHVPAETVLGDHGFQ